MAKGIKFMPAIASDILDFVFPRVCHLCGEKLAEEERYLCTGCLSEMPRTLYHRRPGNPMEMRFAGKFRFERATGHFFYSRDSSLSQLVQDLKYRGFRGIGRCLGEVVGRELYPTGFFADIDCILPVPMHFMKKARRGYNQTEEIARGLNEATGIPVADNLVAPRSSRSQTTLTEEERRRNARGRFKLRRGEELAGKHVLILDDICTTGSTMTAAADAIEEGDNGTRISLLSIGVTF